jgi:hypothetical protein
LEALLDHAATGSRLAFVPATLARTALRAMELACLVPASEWHYATARGTDSTVDLSRAVKELDWQPRWSNRAALCAAYDWYCAALAARGEARSIHPLPATHRALDKILGLLLR